MKNKPIYIKIKNFVDAQGYTIQQIKNVTPPQVKSLVGLDDEELAEYIQWSSSIKKCLIADLQEAADKQKFAELKAVAKNWLDANFPDWDAKKDFSDKDNRIVTIYLDGSND